MTFFRQHKTLSLSAAIFCSLVLFSQNNLYAARAPWIGETLEGATCRGKNSTYGPYDYMRRYQYKKHLRLVEGAHFNSNVELLKQGAKHRDNLLGDIDYTLRAFPNHHRALYTVVRYRLLKGSYNTYQLSPAECYLQRAIKFNPEDGISRMIYGILFHKLGKKNEALKMYRSAKPLAPDNAELNYNLALLLCELKEYEEANELAQSLYKSKFPLNGLKNRLIKAKQWNENLNP